MIDGILARRGKDIFVDDYAPDQALTAVMLHNSEAAKLTAIFPPWHGGGRFTDALVKRLVASNHAVLNCEFHDQILEPHAERVIESFHYLQRVITDELQRLQEEHDYQNRIHLLGISLGNVAMALVAEEFKDFSSATMVIAGSNMAGAVWDGSRTQGIARPLGDQGYTKAELEEAWHELAPKTHAPAFRDKEVRAIISKRDSFIPTPYQIEMRDELVGAGVPLNTRYTRTGHAATITRFCMSRGKIE